MWAMGDQDFDEPVAITGSVFDQMAATLMAFGIVCALIGRDKQGISQEVHVSLLGGALHLQRQHLNMALWRGHPHRRYTRKRSANPMSNNYKCGDGKWIMLAEPMSDRFWAEFCDIMGLNDIKDDPRFAVHFGGRSKNNVELIQIIDKAFDTKSRDEWVKLFDERQVQFGYTPVYDLSEASKDVQAIENDYITDFDHQAMGQIQMTGFPIWFPQTPAYTRREAPVHGQHTEEVLTEVLGYDWDEIVKLKDAGVI
jgi:crotonobetainyl-CoA:carnitine CoA-transferase CaiB-like acyl-CoA transferase